MRDNPVPEEGITPSWLQTEISGLLNDKHGMLAKKQEDVKLIVSERGEADLLIFCSGGKQICILIQEAI